MKKLLNTLYITNPDLLLGRDGQTIIIRSEEEKLGQFPIHNFEDIVCFNYTGISPALLALCNEHNVRVTYLSPTGRYIGTFKGPIRGNVLLRREQFRIAQESDASLQYAKLFTLGKIANSLRLVDRFFRDHEYQLDEKARTELQTCLSRLKESRYQCIESTTSANLFGVEGDASREYFRVFPLLITNQEEGFEFKSRNRRPPLDRVNALLSLSYSLLRTRVESGLETIGLDPYVGFFHTDRPGRSSLALDLMEELRPIMGDRFVLSIINRNQMIADDFIEKENGAVLLTDDGFKKFIDLWNKAMQEKIKHPFLEETMAIGLLPYVQSMLLARTIRGELDLYPPYFAPN